MKSTLTEIFSTAPVTPRGRPLHRLDVDMKLPKLVRDSLQGLASAWAANRERRVGRVAEDKRLSWGGLLPPVTAVDHIRWADTGAVHT